MDARVTLSGMGGNAATGPDRRRAIGALAVAVAVTAGAVLAATGAIRGERGAPVAPPTMQASAPRTGPLLP